MIMQVKDVDDDDDDVWIQEVVCFEMFAGDDMCWVPIVIDLWI